MKRTELKQARTMSDSGSQSDSSFEARQPQATEASETIDKPSSSVNLEESKIQMEKSTIDAESGITGLVGKSDIELGIVSHVLTDDCKCGRDHLLQVKD